MGQERRVYAQPIAIWVYQAHSRPGNPFFIDKHADHLRYAIDVLRVEVNQGVRAGVAPCVPRGTAGRTRVPPGRTTEARLERILPLLDKSEPLIPGDSPPCIFDTKNRPDLLVHRVEAKRSGSKNL
jgi:hypothetical protein